jgi:hypothetical protein
MKNKHLAGFIGAIILLPLLLLPSIGMSETKHVGVTTGMSYNEVWKKWLAKSIMVDVDDNANIYIMEESSIFLCRGLIFSYEREKVISLLKKSQEWSKIAMQDHIQLTKELGSFVKNNNNPDPLGIGLNKLIAHGIKLTFISKNLGNQTFVILTITDFEHFFSTTDLYLNQEQVIQLNEDSPQQA